MKEKVAEVYLGLPAGASKPPKRLVAFKKVFLLPRESKRIQLTIDPKAHHHPLGYGVTASQEWRIADGSYKVLVGESAGSIALEETVLVVGQH